VKNTRRDRMRGLALAIFVAAVAVAVLWLAPDSASAEEQDTGNLATLHLQPQQVVAGRALTVVGLGFQTDGPPVLLYWNDQLTPMSPPLPVDRAGRFLHAFFMPSMEQGLYIIRAEQRNELGIHAYGTPARATIEVLGPNGESVLPKRVQQEPIVPMDPSSSGIIALTVGLGSLGLAIFCAGFVAFVRQARRRDVPVTASVRK
jgi:hypothetical protein